MRVSWALLLLVICCQTAYAQEGKTSDSITVQMPLEGDTNYIRMSFAKNRFQVDSMSNSEGMEYMIHEKDSAADLVFAAFDPSFRLPCCDGGAFIIARKNTNYNVIDKRGKIINTDLYWREVQMSFLHFFYMNVSSSGLKFYDGILDKVKEKLKL